VSDATGELVEHFFRHAYGRVVATLARRFGLDALEAAEDAVQEAMGIALQSWPARGTPADPTAWLYQVANRHLLDRLRRADRWDRITSSHPGEAHEEASAPAPTFAAEIGDDDLRMLFVCCDPDLVVESQIALALKLLCGFSTREIALRLFTTEANVYKRLERGRIRLAARPLALDTPPDVATRLPAVHTVLYLLFNEGYGARGDTLVRRELCEEALRLCARLLEHPGADVPATRALRALMHLHLARLPTRVDATGELLTLEDQDRAQWDRAHIEQGMRWLHASAEGGAFTRFHAEAAIAVEHVTAPSFDDTRWLEIAQLYLLLDRVAPSPLNRLNRAVAIACASGPQAGLDSLVGVRLPPGIEAFYLWDAVVGDLQRRAGDLDAARVRLARALTTAPSDAERALLRRRLDLCGA
jgi:RNA polymerase sigma-70 factor (ECF subfamily)